MFADIPFLPEQASTISRHVDAVFLYILGVCVFFTVLIGALVIFFAIKYRRRSETEIPPVVVGATRLEIAWTVVPLLLSLVMFGWGAAVYFAEIQPPDNALEIYVVGRQWMWKIQHPGGQREINELHIPVGQPVKLLMTSEDVIHDFYVPAFRTKMDVVPGRYTRTWFQATKTGRFHLFCAEYCGTEHSRMRGTVVVMEPQDYQKWLTDNADLSTAMRGRQLFQKLQCITCHSATASAQAPVLEGLYNQRVALQDGRSAIADENYFRESILQPDAKVVAGYQPIMPTYVLKKNPNDPNDPGQLTEDDLMQLIIYLKSLRTGQTPPRVEEAEPPAKKLTPK